VSLLDQTDQLSGALAVFKLAGSGQPGDSGKLALARY
jgi:hypothetical protein